MKLSKLTTSIAIALGLFAFSQSINAQISRQRPAQTDPAGQYQSSAMGQQPTSDPGGRNFSTYQSTPATPGYSAPNYQTSGAGSGGGTRSTGGSSSGTNFSFIQQSLVGASFGDMGKMTEVANRIAAFDANRVVPIAVSGTTVTVKAIHFDKMDQGQGSLVRLWFGPGDNPANSIFFAIPMQVTMLVECNSGFYLDGVQPMGNQAVIRTWVLPRDNGIRGRADKDPRVFAFQYGGGPIYMDAGDARFSLYMSHSTEEQVLVLGAGTLKQWSSDKQGTLSTLQRQ